MLDLLQNYVTITLGGILKEYYPNAVFFFDKLFLIHTKTIQTEICTYKYSNIFFSISVAASPVQQLQRVPDVGQFTLKWPLQMRSIRRSTIVQLSEWRGADGSSL
jgi:hypothetical protein